MGTINEKQPRKENQEQQPISRRYFIKILTSIASAAFLRACGILPKNESSSLEQIITFTPLPPTIEPTSTPEPTSTKAPSIPIHLQELSDRLGPSYDLRLNSSSQKWELTPTVTPENDGEPKPVLIVENESTIRVPVEDHDGTKREDLVNVELFDVKSTVVAGIDRIFAINNEENKEKVDLVYLPKTGEWMQPLELHTDAEDVENYTVIDNPTLIWKGLVTASEALANPVTPFPDTALVPSHYDFWYDRTVGYKMINSIPQFSEDTKYGVGFGYIQDNVRAYKGNIPNQILYGYKFNFEDVNGEVVESVIFSQANVLTKDSIYMSHHMFGLSELNRDGVLASGKPFNYIDDVALKGKYRPADAKVFYLEPVFYYQGDDQGWHERFTSYVYGANGAELSAISKFLAANPEIDPSLGLKDELLALVKDPNRDGLIDYPLTTEIIVESQDTILPSAIRALPDYNVSP